MVDWGKLADDEDEPTLPEGAGLPRPPRPAGAATAAPPAEAPPSFAAEPTVEANAEPLRAAAEASTGAPRPVTAEINMSLADATQSSAGLLTDISGDGPASASGEGPAASPPPSADGPGLAGVDEDAATTLDLHRPGSLDSDRDEEPTDPLRPPRSARSPAPMPLDDEDDKTLTQHEQPVSAELYSFARQNTNPMGTPLSELSKSGPGMVAVQNTDPLGTPRSAILEELERRQQHSDGRDEGAEPPPVGPAVVAPVALEPPSAGDDDDDETRVEDPPGDLSLSGPDSGEPVGDPAEADEAPVGEADQAPIGEVTAPVDPADLAPDDAPAAEDPDDDAAGPVPEADEAPVGEVTGDMGDEASAGFPPEVSDEHDAFFSRTRVHDEATERVEREAAGFDDSPAWTTGEFEAFKRKRKRNAVYAAGGAVVALLLFVVLAEVLAEDDAPGDTPVDGEVVASDDAASGSDSDTKLAANVDEGERDSEARADAPREPPTRDTDGSPKGPKAGSEKPAGADARPAKPTATASRSPPPRDSNRGSSTKSGSTSSPKPTAKSVGKSGGKAPEKAPAPKTESEKPKLAAITPAPAPDPAGASRVLNVVAPRRIKWTTPTGKRLGSGSGSLKVPGGVEKVVAHDPKTDVRTFISVDTDGIRYDKLPRGKLDIRAFPYATVWAGKRKLGDAPFAPVEVVEGQYRLRFVFQDQIEKRTVKVKAGRTTRVGVKFSPKAK